MTITQIILTIFIFFAFTRVILRFRSGTVSFFGLIFWTALFGCGFLMVIMPVLSSDIANILGIGRGVDAIIYISIVLLFYLVFRLYVYLEDIKRDITQLVRKIAIKEKEKNEKKNSSDN